MTLTHCRCAGLKNVHKISKDDEKIFYDDVWKDIDLSGLLRLRGDGDETGYHHGSNLKDLLARVHGPKYIASNSPIGHVSKVLCALGLASAGWKGIYTPDKTENFHTKTDREFWREILAAHPKEKGYKITLIDDSDANLRVAGGAGLVPIKVSERFRCVLV